MKKIKKKLTPKVILLLYCAFLFLVLGVIYYSSVSKTVEKQPFAMKGKMDLSNIELEKSGIIRLDGEWEFYFKELLTPQEFKKKDSGAEHFMEMPNVWKNEKVDGQEISKYGYGTYRVRIKEKGESSFYGLRIPYLYTANKIWINGELMVSSGEVGKSEESTVPRYTPEVVFFTHYEGEIEIVMQVANYARRTSSCLSIEFGTQKQIIESKYKHLILDAFLAGSSFIMALYYIALHYRRKKDKSAFYFGLFCLLISFRTMVVGERIFCIIFPNYEFHLFLKGIYGIVYLAVPIFVSFLRELYPEEISLGMKKASAYFAGFAVTIVLFTNHKIYDWTLPIYETFLLGVFALILYNLIKACIKEKEGAMAITLGYILVVFTIINDVLFDNKIVNTGNLIPFGLFLFTVFQAYAISVKYTKEIEKRIEVERLLKDAIEYDKIKNEFIASISHEFRTPLNVIFASYQMFEQLLSVEGIEQDREKMRKYMRMTKQNCYRLMRLINNLIDITKMDAGYLKLNLQNYNIIKIVEDITLSVASYVEQKNLTLVFDTEAEEVMLACDPDTIERIMLNLLSNAIKFTEKGGNIYVNMEVKERIVRIIVEDTGIGIPMNKLRSVFERFVQVDKSLKRSSEGSGIGLALVKSLVNLHKGRVFVESIYGKGSKFIVELPIVVLQSNEETENKQMSNYEKVEKINIEFSDIYF